MSGTKSSVADRLSIRINFLKLLSQWSGGMLQKFYDSCFGDAMIERQQGHADYCGARSKSHWRLEVRQA